MSERDRLPKPIEFSVVLCPLTKASLIPLISGFLYGDLSATLRNAYHAKKRVKFRNNRGMVTGDLWPARGNGFVEHM